MLTVRNRGIGRASIACALIGCDVLPEPPEPNLGVHEAHIDPYISHQGRLLLGFKDPDVRQFYPPSWQFSVTDDGELIMTNGAGEPVRGTRLAGMLFASSGTTSNVQLRIADVVPGHQGKRWQYRIEQLDTSGWATACDTTPPLLPHSEGDPSLAFALPGWFRPDGTYRNDSNQLSFACRRGVVAKCISWGYAPGHARDVVSGDMLQACTRMARADYCATGVSHTFDGTPIHKYDITAFPQNPSPDDGFTFEAAWPGSEPGRGNGPEARPAICLSKLRWSSLPLGGDCPAALPDPRIVANAHYCDDLSPTVLEDQGALVMVDSAYIDVGLYTWNMGGSELATTAFLSGRSSGLEYATPRPGAPTGLTLPTQFVPERFEGGLYNPDVRNPVRGALPASMMLVRSFRCGNDYVTTAADLSSPSCTQIFDSEGLAYPPYTADRRKLRRWWDPLSGSTTTTRSPTTMLTGSRQLVEVIGGVVGAGSDVSVRWDTLGGAQYWLEVQTQDRAWNACIDPRTSTAAMLSPSATTSSICPANPRTITLADVIAIRIGYSLVKTEGSVEIPYDRAQSDVYVELPGGSPTALTLSWNGQSPRLRYAVDLHAGTTWYPCATELHLANDNELVLPGRCPVTRSTFALASADKVRLCAAIDGDWKRSTCVLHPLDSTLRRITFEVPAISIPD